MTTADEPIELIQCPGCGLYAAHAMRAPRTVFEQDEAAQAAYMEALSAKIDEAVEGGMSWSEASKLFFPGEREEVTGVAVPAPLREVPDPAEAMWSTIRVCRCGQEWGQG